jgi:ACS family glucarate transporter-like MFS transporter
VRYLILAILFAVSCFRYGDRVALSLAGAAMAKAITTTPTRMGYLFSAFSWAYGLNQQSQSAE